jgi:hypothetical protein
MRKLIAVPTVLTILILAPASFALLPSGGSRFKGTTSAAKIGRFKDPVSFKVGSDASTISKFKFGTLGCFGSGGPPPTKNPYTRPFNTAKMPTISIDSKGQFSGTAQLTIGQVPTTSKVTGKFRKKSGKMRASGKITVSQTFQGQSCGPATMSYSASAK